MNISEIKKQPETGNQESSHGNPNMQLGGLNEPWPWPEEGYSWVNSITRWEKIEGGIAVTCATTTGQACSVKFLVYSPEVVRILAELEGTEPQKEKLALLQNEDIPQGTFQVADEEDRLVLSTSSLHILMKKNPWTLEIQDHAGKILTAENRRDTNLRGWRRVSHLGFSLKDGKVEHVLESFGMKPQENLYGLGEKFIPVQKRGQVIESWNFNVWGTSLERSYKNIPLLLSTQGYGLFFHTTSPIQYDLGSGKHSSVSYEFAVEANCLDLFFIYGPGLYKVIDRYTDLTGKAPVPPKWSYGLWMSKFGYRSRAELEEISNKVEEHGVSCDVLHLDPYWMKENMYADLIWDEERFPNPKEMLQGLLARGYQVCLWIQPWIPKISPVYQELAEKGCFAKNANGEVYEYVPTIPGEFPNYSGLVDFSHPEMVRWYQERLQGLVNMGVAAFKTDFGEAIPEDAVFYNGMTGREMHNYYPFLYNQTVYGVVGNRLEGGLVWARSAYAGCQRFPVSWGGDPLTTFEAMACQLWGGLSYGLSGVPYWSNDIGGFKGDPTSELYIRWAQMGLLGSHARCHGWSPREPWIFGEETLQWFKIFNDLRYRLIPYLYSYSHVASQTGAPLMRAMVLEFEEDLSCRYLDLQYMLGRELLVAPVFNQEGKVDVYLPEGTWLNWWSGEQFKGSRFIHFDKVPFSEVPLFVRENSLLPLADPAKNTRELAQQDHLTLLVYVADEAEFILQDDHVVTHFKAEMKEGLEITWQNLRVSKLTLVIHDSRRMSVAQFEGQTLPFANAENDLGQVFHLEGVKAEGQVNVLFK